MNYFTAAIIVYIASYWIKMDTYQFIIAVWVLTTVYDLGDIKDKLESK